MSGGMMKPCPVHGCGALILADRLVCHAHWMLLPLDVRKQLARLKGSQKGEAAERKWVAFINGLNRRTRREA